MGSKGPFTVIMAALSRVSAKKNMILVAAIDFGTTYSGYAFSFKDDYNTDPTKISINQKWEAGSTPISSYKAPTAVLFDPDGQFDSFGYEAEEAYLELALDNEHHDWHYFSRFKMRLHNEKVHREVELQDDEGNSLPAIEVFGKVIWYLKDHLLKALENTGTTVKNEDIHWIITVPAIWKDSSKQFMREAAYKADIAGAQLTIALEPEAASLYCQTKKIHGTAKFDVSIPGSRYMVIDLGGGTADITVHEKQINGSLKELHKASGGAWGGTKVDEEFRKMLIKLFGGPVLDKFCRHHRGDYLYLMRELESKKRTIKPDTKPRKITMKVPVKLPEIYTEETGESIEDAIKGSPYAGKLAWLGDKMRIDATVFKSFFKDCMDKIVQHIGELLSKPEVKGTDLLLMVGGFSESTMMQNAIKSAFKNCQVIIPDDAGLCVMKGAVIFGHRPVAITSRVSRYTYGINISPPFDPSFHPESQKVTVGGRERCKNVFKTYIEEGKPIEVGEEIVRRHITLNTHQTEMLLNVYASPKKSPQFVDEPEVELLGQVTVQLPDSDELIKVEVKMIFGETELRVEATEESTSKNKETFTSFFDFL